MKKRSLVLAFIGTLFVAGAGLVDAAEQNTTRQLSVNGQAAVMSTPDLFHFSIYIEQKGQLVSKLNSSVRDTSEQVVKLLSKSGVKETDIQSLHVQLQPWYEFNNNQREHKGFILSRKISVTLRKLDNYDDIIDGVLRQGVTRIENFNYSVADPERDYLQALEAAIADAKRRADKMAAALGVSIDTVLTITEGQSYSPMPMVRKTMSMADESGGYMPGQISTDAQVSVTFSLK